MIEQSLSISEARRVISSLPDIFEEGVGVILVTLKEFAESQWQSLDEMLRELNWE